MGIPPGNTMIQSLRGIVPRIASSAYIHPGAHVIGDVTIGERASVWPTAVLRGDIEPISVGDDTNIQDGAILHTDRGFPTQVGARVTIGHSAIVHGCVIEDDVVIGSAAIVLTGAKIRSGAVVAAGALVPEGAEVAANTLVMGTPAKPRREVSEEEKVRFAQGVENYAKRAQDYKEPS
jgi:carbonic anhydrase/acetyltransferase-like protein (isoleucine patch superfamily)